MYELVSFECESYSHLSRAHGQASIGPGVIIQLHHLNAMSHSTPDNARRSKLFQKFISVSRQSNGVPRTTITTQSLPPTLGHNWTKWWVFAKNIAPFGGAYCMLTLDFPKLHVIGGQAECPSAGW
jgi:hypothetical protein